MTKDEALDLALEELENCADLLKVFEAPIDSCVGATMLQAEAAITAIKQALALDKKAENARELGLDYEPVATLFGSLPVYDITPPAQEPVAWVDLLKQAEEVVRSKSLWKKYIDGTPLANDIAVWMANFAEEHTTPQEAQPVPVARVAEVHMSRYTIEWTNGPLSEGTELFARPPSSGPAVADDPDAVVIEHVRNTHYKVRMRYHLPNGTRLYTTPPAQPAPVPLTEKELRKMHHEDQFGLFCDFDEFEQIVRATEQSHGITEKGQP